MYRSVDESDFSSNVYMETFRAVAVDLDCLCLVLVNILYIILDQKKAFFVLWERKILNVFDKNTLTRKSH